MRTAMAVVNTEEVQHIIGFLLRKTERWMNCHRILHLSPPSTNRRESKFRNHHLTRRFPRQRSRDLLRRNLSSHKSPNGFFFTRITILNCVITISGNRRSSILQLLSFRNSLRLRRINPGNKFTSPDLHSPTSSHSRAGLARRRRLTLTHNFTTNLRHY